MEAPEDQTLIDQMRHGRSDAIGILFDRYSRLIFAVAKKILRDPEEAEDLTQEVFIEIYKKAHLYDANKGTVKVWLLQYAYHRSLNRRRYLALRSFSEVSPTMMLTHLEIAADRDGFEAITNREWQERLKEGMKELTEKERQIINLVSIDGLTMREASARTRESYASCRNRYYRGLKKLRDFFRPVEATGEGTGVRSRTV